MCCHLSPFVFSQEAFWSNCITRVKCSRLPVDLGGQWIFALQYNILSAVKHFIAYGPVSVLFWATKQYCFEISFRLQGRLSCMLHRSLNIYFDAKVSMLHSPSSLGLDGDEERLLHHEGRLEVHQKPSSPCAQTGICRIISSNRYKGQPCRLGERWSYTCCGASL